MSSKDKQISVIIAGATSSIGRELVSRLVSHPNVQRVVALSRQPISVNRWATVFPHLHTGDALRYLSVVPVDWSKILTDTSRIPFSYVVNGSWHFTEMDARERKKLSSRLATLHELWTLPYKKTLHLAQFNNTTTSAINNLNNNNNNSNNGKYNAGQSTAFPANHVYDADNNTIHKMTSPEVTQRGQQNFERGYVSSFPRYSRVNYGRANSYRHRSLHRNRERYIPEITHLESSRSQETLQQHKKINKTQSLELDQETNMSNGIGSNNADSISVRHSRITNTNNTCPSSTQNLEEAEVTIATTKTNTQHVGKAHFLPKASSYRKYKHSWWHLITSFVSSPLSIIEQMTELSHNSTKSSSPSSESSSSLSPSGATSTKSTINVLSDEEIMENKVFLQKLLENNFYNSVFAGHHVAINCLGSAHPLSSSELSQVDYGLSLAFTKVVRLFNCMSYVEANDEEERELVQRISRELNSELWGEIYTACYGTASEATPMLYSSSSSSSSCDYSHNHSVNHNDSHNTQVTHTSLSYGKVRREDEANGVNRRCTLQHFTQISARGASEFSPIPYLRAHGRRDRDLIKMFEQTPSHQNVNSANKHSRAKSTWNTLSEMKQNSEDLHKNRLEHEQLPVSISNNNSNSGTEKCTMEVSEEVAAEQARTLLLRRDIVHVNHHVNLTIWRPGVFRRAYMRWPEWVISFLEQPLDLHCLAECVVDDIIESIHRYEEAAKQQDTIADNVDKFVSSSSNSSINVGRDDTNLHTKSNKCDDDSSSNNDDITSDVINSTNTDTNAVSSTLKIIGGKSVAQRVFMKAAEDGLDERDTKLPKSRVYNKYTHW